MSISFEVGNSWLMREVKVKWLEGVVLKAIVTEISTWVSVVKMLIQGAKQLNLLLIFCSCQNNSAKRSLPVSCNCV